MAKTKKSSVIGTKDVCRLVKEVSGDSLYVIERVLDAYAVVIKRSLIQGFAVTLRGIGKFKPRFIPAQPEKDIQTPNGLVTVPPKEQHLTPVFSYTPTCKSIIKTESSGTDF